MIRDEISSSHPLPSPRHAYPHLLFSSCHLLFFFSSAHSQIKPPCVSRHAWMDGNMIRSHTHTHTHTQRVHRMDVWKDVMCTLFVSSPLTLFFSHLHPHVSRHASSAVCTVSFSSCRPLVLMHTHTRTQDANVWMNGWICDAYAFVFPVSPLIVFFFLHTHPRRAVIHPSLHSPPPSLTLSLYIAQVENTKRKKNEKTA